MIGRTAVFLCAMGLLLAAGCGTSESKKDGSTSKSGNAIERTAEKGPVKLVVRVSPREPRLSDLVDLDVIVETQAGVEIKPPAFGQAMGDFLIRDYSERPPETAGGASVRRCHCGAGGGGLTGATALTGVP